MRKSDEPLTDTLVRCLADPMDLKALERLENDGDQAGARLMRARLADQAALRLDAALEDNRARVRRQLGRDWAWATDEVMSDLTIRTIRRLDYWHRTNTDRAEGGSTAWPRSSTSSPAPWSANGSKTNGPNTARA